MCQKLIFSVIILCLVLCSTIHAYPNGAPTNEPSCFGLQPTHSDPISGEQYPNQQGPRPFRIELSTGVYQPCVMPLDCRRAPITVTIRGLSQYFRGFIVQARTTFGGVKSYGQFIPLGNLVSKTIQCQNGQTLTQSTNNDRTVIQFQWLPEPNMNEPFKFRATVVQDVQTIYTGIESTEISPPGPARDDKKRVSNPTNQRQFPNVGMRQNSGPKQMFILTPSPQEPFDYPDKNRGGGILIPNRRIPITIPNSVPNAGMQLGTQNLRMGIGVPISSRIPISSPQTINKNRFGQPILDKRLRPLPNQVQALPGQAVSGNQMNNGRSQSSSRNQINTAKMVPGQLSPGNQISNQQIGGVSQGKRNFAPSAGGLSQSDTQTMNNGIKPMSNSWQNRPERQNSVIGNRNIRTNPQTINQQQTNQQLGIGNANFQQSSNTVVRSDINQINTNAQRINVRSKQFNQSNSLQKNTTQLTMDSSRNTIRASVIKPSYQLSGSQSITSPDFTVDSTTSLSTTAFITRTSMSLGSTNKFISDNRRKQPNNFGFGDGSTNTDLNSDDPKNNGYRLISSSIIMVLPFIILVL